MIIDFSILFNAIIVGFILFQVSLNVPVIFATLPPENASPFLRAIFPRFFIFIFTFSFLALFLLFLSNNRNNVQIVCNSINVCMSGICYILIPYTNKARDEGNDKLFSLYHNLSVLFTLSMLALNITAFFNLR